MKLRKFVSRYREKGLWLLLVAVFALSYFLVPFIFFQQDEFFTFGVFNREGLNALRYFFSIKNLDHLAPITTSLSFVLYSFGGLNYTVFNLLGLLIHLVNGLLICGIAKDVFKNKSLAILTSIIFFSASQAHEIIMWPVASLNALSLTFSLLAIAVLIKRLNDRGYLNICDNLLISLFFLCAVFSIEYAVSLILLIPFAVFILSKSKKKALLSLVPFGLVVAAYLFWRFVPILTSNQPTNIDMGGPARIKRLITLPTLYLGQLFLGQDLLLGLSKRIFSLYFKSSQDVQFVETVIYKYVTAFFAGISLIIMAVIYWQARSKYAEQAKYFLIFFFFIIFNAIPFTLIPGGYFLFSIVPSRYLYFGLVSYSFLLVLIFYFSRKGKKLFRMIVVLILVLVVISGIVGNFKASSGLYSVGKIRLGILEKIEDLYPKLSQKVVFYTESDQSYYGLPPEERILPFQSGFGQTLLVWYQKTEKFPVGFFKDRFLWEMKDQGYKEFGDRGFGYFRNFKELATFVAKNNFDRLNIIGFGFDSSTNQLFDNTAEIRGRLTGYLTEKRLIRNSEFSLIASENNNQIYLARDGARHTAWRSKLPYSYHQSIEVDFRAPRKVAEIVIDSYNDINQNEVGYAISVSDDRKLWKRIFFAKRYPPDKAGLTEIYFQPSKAKYVKIDQVGEHKYASWVVSELNFYESVQ